MKNTVFLPRGRLRSLQRRWVVKRPSPCPPEPLPEPMPGFGAMPPRGGGPLPSRSRIIPLPTMLREPPGPRSLRLMSRRSSPPRVSRSRTALVFFSSTFSRTSPRNMMGCKEKRTVINKGKGGQQNYLFFQIHNPYHSLVCTQVFHLSWNVSVNIKERPVLCSCQQNN